MDQNELKTLIDNLPDEKKAFLLSRLEQDTGVTAEKLAQAAKDPSTAAKLNRLAAKVDPSALAALADDPKKLASLLASPQVKNALKGLDLG